MFSFILTIIITSLQLLTKNPLVITPVPSILKVNAPSDIKKPIIHNLISRAKLVSSSKTIFYKEVENIKQAFINNGFPNYIVNEQIKRMIKNVNQQNKHCTTQSSQQTYIKLFYRNQVHNNNKSDEKTLKTLIHRNILLTDPNKKIKLIIYYKFKTSNLVIRNNSSPSIGVLQKKKNNVLYKFKCPLGDCISDNNNIYVGLTSTTLSRRLTMHFSGTSSITQHLKNIHAQQHNYGNFHRQHNNIRTSKQ